MAEFLKNTQLVSAIEELIERADKWLCLISPYIKIHDRVKDYLRTKKHNTNLHLIVVFGKNEGDVSKSLSKEDFDFLKEFPFVTIGYEKRLHAKYYASEDFSIITSMNLHEFSQNNNIEVGIKLSSKLLSVNTADADAEDYFLNVIENCTVIYKKEPQYKGGIMGFGASFSHSEIIEDQTDNFFKKKELKEVKFQIKKPSESTKPAVPPIASSATGFCIRTGKPIPFNVQRPMTMEAWKEWNKTKNTNHPENFCHYSGEPSNGETCYSKPIMRKNWSKAKSLQ